MRFAGAGRAEEVDDLGALDELELGERHDPIAIQRRLKAEVEPSRVFAGVSLAVFMATPMRRLSRTVSSSASS
jgi:hypothetical protein